MTTPDIRLEWLAKRSKRPMEHVRFVPAASEETIRSLECGVLFLMAFWSGGALRAFTELTKVLSTPETQTLDLVVADVDDSPTLYDLPEFQGKIHGWGETAWVHHEKIVATSGVGLNMHCFEPNTAILLSLCQ